MKGAIPVQPRGDGGQNPLLRDDSVALNNWRHWCWEFQSHTPYTCHKEPIAATFPHSPVEAKNYAATACSTGCVRSDVTRNDIWTWIQYLMVPSTISLAFFVLLSFCLAHVSRAEHGRLSRANFAWLNLSQSHLVLLTPYSYPICCQNLKIFSLSATFTFVELILTHL